MSTRGCIAVSVGENRWRGVYNHSDSYPSWLGYDLSEELRRSCKGRSLTDFCRELLRYTNWREFKNGGLCPYCGIVGKGQPHSIDGRISFAGLFSKELLAEGIERLRNSNAPEDREILRNIERTGFPDPECKYHKHTRDDGSPPEAHHITSEDPDPLSIEWVYIINPESETITILHHIGDPRYRGGKVKDVVTKRYGWWDYGHCRYKHFKVAEVSVKDAIDGNVDWERIEREAEEKAAEIALNLLLSKYKNKEKFIIDDGFCTLIYSLGTAVLVTNVMPPSKNVAVYRGDKVNAFRIYLSGSMLLTHAEESLRRLGLSVEVVERRADVTIIE